jgi:ubiquinone/menaquinone biosynthesis C-methylase UbiE
MARGRRSKVKKYHDRVANRYDHSYDDAYWQWHDALTWDYLKPHLPRDLSAAVIDLGTGTGKWALKLIKSGYRVTCLDISHQMLDQARLKVEEAAAEDRAEFVQADLIDLAELPESHFALATAFGEPIGSTRDPAIAMREIHRILAPGGLLVATFDNQYAALDFYLQQGKPDAMGRFLRDGRTHWLTRDQDEQFPIHTHSPAEVIKLAERANFEVVELIGKTVLPMRHYRDLLEDSEDRRAWARIEKKLCRQTDVLARAPHLQLTARAVKR